MKTRLFAAVPTVFLAVVGCVPSAPAPLPDLQEPMARVTRTPVPVEQHSSHDGQSTPMIIPTRFTPLDLARFVVHYPVSGLAQKSAVGTCLRKDYWRDVPG